MLTQHNPKVPLGVIAMISKGCFWQMTNVIIKFVFRAFPYLNPSTAYYFELVLAHFHKSYLEGNLVGAWSRSCLWPFV